MPVDAVATEVAKKIANTRRILGRVTDADLETCIAGYAALDDDSARAIVRLCEGSFHTYEQTGMWMPAAPKNPDQLRLA
jgi:hypothetical protein